MLFFKMEVKNMAQVILKTMPVPQLLTPSDLKIREYIQKRAVRKVSIKRMQEILNKLDINLTETIIEERERDRW